MGKQPALHGTCVSFFGLLLVFLVSVGCAPAKVNPEAVKLAQELPIADLHLHPRHDIPPTEIKDRMDANGVRWAGAGTIGERSVTLAHSNALGERFIAFAGQGELNRAYFDGGVGGTEDVNNAAVQNLLQSAEEDLRAGRIKGIGEIFVNNSRSNPNPSFRRKFRADAPSMRALYQLVAKYSGFLTFHMESDSDSVGQLERLLESDRKGRILLNHCGVGASAAQVRPLFEMHPNVFCELSGRYPPVLSSQAINRFPEREIFNNWRGPDAGWLQLIEGHPDRFMIGTDANSRSEYDGAIKAVREGLLPYLRPATARKVAYENAQRLFGLK